jgi:octaprenyl-diphosphate synthase
MEFLHSATLLHDDIVDGADLRRDQATAHTLFGHTRTILAGDILLALANRLVADYDIPRLNGAMAEGIYRTAAGEILEISHLRNPGLGLGEYLDIVTGKTACLMAAACRCGALLAGAGDALVERAAGFGLNLGIAFQLVDDALDYSSCRAVAGKPVGADLREGKLTLPLILYFESLDAARRARLGEGFRNASLGGEEMDAIVAEVNELGLDRKTRDVAREYLDRAAEDLAAFPESRETAVLRDTLEFLHRREK